MSTPSDPAGLSFNGSRAWKWGVEETQVVRQPDKRRQPSPQFALRWGDDGGSINQSGEQLSESLNVVVEASRMSVAAPGTSERTRTESDGRKYVRSMPSIDESPTRLCTR